MRSYILSLGVLTGSQQPNFRQAGWWYHNRGGGKDNYSSGEIYNAGNIMPGLRLRLREQSWADAPLTCIWNHYPSIPGFSDGDTSHLTSYEADPGIAPCHVRDTGEPTGDNSFAMFRFEYPVSFSLRASGQDNVTNFWDSNGLASFLAGSYDAPLGNTLWTMRSTYVDDLKVRPRLNTDGIVELVFEESDRKTGWQDDHNDDHDPYTGIGWPFEEHITPTKLVDLLEFACKVSERATDVVFQCDPTNPSAVPNVNSKADVKKLHAYLECAANEIHRVGERLVIPNLPDTLVAGFQSNGMESLYGEYSGENLKTLVLLEDNLRSLGTATENISTTLSLAAQDLRDVELALENLGIQSTITDLNTVRKVIQSAISAINATKGRTPIRSGFQVGMYAVIAGLDIAIGELEKDIIDNNEDLEYSRAIRAFIERMQGLSGVFNGIAQTYGQIQTNLTTLDQNQNEASMWWAIGMGMDGDLAGHLFPVNTVMRRRQNTLRIRYEEAAKRAKKLSFIARRAIEFRLGVDLSKMHSELTLVPAPSSWADRICEMQGFDYDRLRTAYPEDEELLDPELQNADNYAHWYIGDYVTLLSDFVQSYNQDFPFTDERDTAVISVRDDLLLAREPCKIPSRNMLYHSENVGANTNLENEDTGVTYLVGWQPMGCEFGTITGCVETEVGECQATEKCLARIPDDPLSEYCGSDFCYGYNHESVQAATDPPSLRGAERLQDQSMPPWIDGELQQNGRIDTWQNSGYYEQVVTGVASGNYILSWWIKVPLNPPGPGPITFPPQYKVEVVGGDGETLIVPSFVEYPPSNWMRRTVNVEVSEAQDLSIRIHPSANGGGHANPVMAEFGDIWIWGVQLEKIHCPEGDCAEVEANEFQSTEHELTTTVQNCPDYDGSALRNRFKYRCVCVGFENGICPEGSYGASYRQCFWELPFEISLNQIEKGELIPSNNIAIGNFNYRHEAMSINIVGTNVLQCSYPEDPASCYTNAFVPYTMQHDGWVEVKNHDRERMTYHMPIARVEHGKGLTAEVVLTNPVSGTHNQLLTDFWKDGLRGRPLQGQYLLRIWNADNLNWNAIEDIQIAWKYRYWTQMSGY